jgi:hypothetical protein
MQPFKRLMMNFERHIPALFNAIVLALSGCFVLFILGNSEVRGLSLIAVISFSVLLIFFSICEMILLLLDGLRELWYMVREAARAIQGLTAEQRELLQPRKEPNITQFKLVSSVGSSFKMMILKIPVEPQKLRTIAMSLISGNTFAERRFVPWLLKSKKFRELQDMFEARGYIELCNPDNYRLGYKLTRGGEPVMRYIVRAVPMLEQVPPLPPVLTKLLDE